MLLFSTKLIIIPSFINAFSRTILTLFNYNESFNYKASITIIF